MPPDAGPGFAAQYALGATRWVRAVILSGYVLAQLLVVLYSSHRYLVLWRSWRARLGRAPFGHPGAADPAESWPVVTVQLPIYNERLVVDRKLDRDHRP